MSCPQVQLAFAGKAGTDSYHDAAGFLVLQWLKKWQHLHIAGYCSCVPGAGITLTRKIMWKYDYVNLITADVRVDNERSMAVLRAVSHEFRRKITVEDVVGGDHVFREVTMEKLPVIDHGESSGSEDEAEQNRAGQQDGEEEEEQAEEGAGREEEEGGGTEEEKDN